MTRGGKNERREIEFSAEKIISRMRAEYWKSIESPPEGETDVLAPILLFKIGRENFAIEVTAVREVTLVPALVAKVPRGSQQFFGVMNLRGQILPIMDFRPTIGAPVSTPVKESRVLVVRGADGDIGVLCDEVAGMRDIPVKAMSAPSKVETRLPAAVQKAQVEVDGRVFTLIDADGLLRLEGVI